MNTSIGQNSITVEDIMLNSQPIISQEKCCNLVDPLAQDFNFDLWATLVRQQMRTVVRKED